ncbi:hypothetical protein GCM10011581_30450 [Saccharopolyspora subtropica]|uniref:Uncharacterized protein n=1 Tax=Saccharopolyspora thermophila TaxID=89367 RepID=A0A917JXL4_9PSEU|nr:hypothetical protein GCM10011581_30450 [Saccharopolyspora subtropica]
MDEHAAAGLGGALREGPTETVGRAGDEDGPFWGSAHGVLRNLVGDDAQCADKRAGIASERACRARSPPDPTTPDSGVAHEFRRDLTENNGPQCAALPVWVLVTHGNARYTW